MGRLQFNVENLLRAFVVFFADQAQILEASAFWSKVLRRTFN